MNNEDQQATGRKIFLAEGVMANTEAKTFMGNLLTAFALVIGANDRQIGMLNTVRNLSGFFQLLTDHLLQRLGSKRRLFLYSVGTSRSFRVVVAFLPAISLAFVRNNVVWWLIALMFIVGCGDAITMVLRKTWMSELTPPEIRGRYFGLRSLLSDFSGMLIGYLGGLYIDHSRNMGREIFGFQSIFLFSALIGFLTIALIAKVPETKTEPIKQDLGTLLRSFQTPFRDKTFFIWMIYRSCYGFAVGFAGPFFTVYLLRELGLPLATVAIYTAIGEFSSIALARLWGSLADKYGNIKILAISSIGKSIFPALWIFTTGVGSFWAIVYLGFVHSIRGFNSAQNITTLNMTLWLSSDDERPTYLACESTIVSLTAAISPFVGGIILGALSGAQTDVSIFGWQHTLRAMHLLFLISAILRGSASLLLILVKANMSGTGD